jgi:hypothetical protein
MRQSRERRNSGSSLRTRPCERRHDFSGFLRVPRTKRFIKVLKTVVIGSEGFSRSLNWSMDIGVELQALP